MRGRVVVRESLIPDTHLSLLGVSQLPASAIGHPNYGLA